MNHPSQRGMYAEALVDLELGGPPAYLPPQHVSQRKAPPPLTPHARALLQERSKMKLQSLRSPGPDYPAPALVDSSYNGLGGGVNDAVAPLPPPPQPHLSQSPLNPSGSSMAFDGSGAARQGSGYFSSSSGRQMATTSNSNMMVPTASNRQMVGGSNGNLTSSSSSSSKSGGSATPGRVRITEAGAANIAADLGSSSRDMSLAAFNDPQSERQQNPHHIYPGEDGEQQQQQLPMILGVDTYGNPPSTRSIQGKPPNNPPATSSSSEYTPSPYFSAPPPSTLPLSYYPPPPSSEETVEVGGGEEDDWDRGNYSQGGGHSNGGMQEGYRGGGGRLVAPRGGGGGGDSGANAEMLSRLSQGFAAFFGTFFGSILNSLHPEHAQTLIKSTGPLISGLMGHLAGAPIPGVGLGAQSRPLRSTPPPSSQRTLTDSLSSLEDGTAFMGSPWQSRDTFLAQRALLEQMQRGESTRRVVGVVKPPPPPAPTPPPSAPHAASSSLSHTSSRSFLSSATVPPPTLYDDDRAEREDRSRFMPTSRGGYR